jgi:hypothetical protein
VLTGARPTAFETVRLRRLDDDREEKSDYKQVAAALGGLTAQLWVWRDRSEALEWLTGDLAANREVLTSFLSILRSAFFARYASGRPTMSHAGSCRFKNRRT